MSTTIEPIPNSQYYVRSFSVKEQTDSFCLGRIELVDRNSHVSSFEWTARADGVGLRIEGPGAHLPGGGRIAADHKVAYPFVLDSPTNRGIKAIIEKRLQGRYPNHGAPATAPAPNGSSQAASVSHPVGGNGISKNGAIAPEKIEKLPPVLSAATPTSNGSTGADSKKVQPVPPLPEASKSDAHLASKPVVSAPVSNIGVAVRIWGGLTLGQKRIASLFAGGTERLEIAEKCGVRHSVVATLLKKLAYFLSKENDDAGLRMLLLELFKHDPSLRFEEDSTKTEGKCVASKEIHPELPLAQGTETSTSQVSQATRTKEHNADVHENAIAQLTKREKQVAFLLAEGLERKKICERLSLNRPYLCAMLWRIRKGFGVEDDEALIAVLRGMFATKGYLKVKISSLVEALEPAGNQNGNGHHKKEEQKTSLPSDSKRHSAREIIDSFGIDEGSVAREIAKGREIYTIAKELRLTTENVRDIGFSLVKKLGCHDDELSARLKRLFAEVDSDSFEKHVPTEKVQVVTEDRANLSPVEQEKSKDGVPEVELPGRKLFSSLTDEKETCPSKDEELFFVSELRRFREKLPKTHALAFHLASDRQGRVSVTVEITPVA